MRDTDVETHGTSLSGKHILLGISGGIAAVDSVRIARELRRHGATLSVCMTNSAQKIITPLALSWATQGEIITDWDGDMGQLSHFDAVLVCPATRNLLACHLHGIISSPLLMALSAARGNNTPLIFVPSMHSDLAEDPVTSEITDSLLTQGAHVIWGVEEEGKRKTVEHTQVVAELAHMVNSRQTRRKSIVITLGATRSALDDVRYIQNTSSGETGWGIAVELYRHGHDVTVVAGVTTYKSEIDLPLVIITPSPEQMLIELKALAGDEIDCWIHSAAVLDYVVGDPVEGKIASLQGELELTLVEGEKHILELRELTNGATRIGFKLECGVKIHDLIHRALALIKGAELDAVIANRLEDLDDPNKPRAHLVDSTGEHWALNDHRELVNAVRVLVEAKDIKGH
jgi:phosphopantothenoylcysteine decarboxylase/phosphopantothenate--cysteine ligase